MFKSLLDISDLNSKQLFEILSLKNDSESLNGKNIGMIFEKYSTRTRLSFHVGISQLSGNAIDIRFDELNISREESFEDTFMAMNCYLDGLIYRTTSHQKLIDASKYFQKPIINALSDKSHPCQILSDLFTLNEHFKTLNLDILWIGDMNNVCYSLVEAVNLCDQLTLYICSPKSVSNKIDWVFGENIKVIENLSEINLNEIRCIMTDVYVSMNDKVDNFKISSLKNYIVNEKLMSETHKDSVFMHCLPAKIGSEVTKDVFLSPKSIVWKQAYNRMVVQKKLLQYIDWA